MIIPLKRLVEEPEFRRLLFPPGGPGDITIRVETGLAPSHLDC
jgi:hypothetical protein